MFATRRYNIPRRTRGIQDGSRRSSMSRLLAAKRRSTVRVPPGLLKASLWSPARRLAVAIQVAADRRNRHGRERTSACAERRLGLVDDVVILGAVKYSDLSGAYKARAPNFVRLLMRKLPLYRAWGARCGASGALVGQSADAGVWR